jgi:hypothetical protein
MRPIPPALKIVAWLFIIGGIFAVIHVIVSLMSGRISINLGVFGIFIGRGLLRLNPRAFAWAMFFYLALADFCTAVHELCFVRAGQFEDLWSGSQQSAWSRACCGRCHICAGVLAI